MRTNSPLPMFFRNSQPVEDVYTKLLLHLDGVDGAIESSDSSGHNHPLTFEGSTEIDTAQFVFGGSSVKLTRANTDYISIPYSTDFDIVELSTEDATIDFWIKHNMPVSGGAFICFVGQFASDTNWITFMQHPDSKGIAFAIYNGGYQLLCNTGYHLSDENWHHLAMCKSGSEYRIFVDGIQQGYVSSASTHQISTQLVIGAFISESETHGVDGWIDEFRVSKGIARWTSDFTPPTSEY